MIQDTESDFTAAAPRIRSIRPTDVDRLAAFFDTLSERSRAWFHPHPFDRATAERIAHGAGASGPRLLAEIDGRMVGYAFADGSPPVIGLAVGDPWQGRGIGPLLLGRLHAELRRLGRQRVRLTVFKDNERALSLYRSFGYRILGEKTNGPSAGLEWIMEADLHAEEENHGG